LTKPRDEEAEHEFKLGHFPLTSLGYSAERTEPEPSVDHNPNTSHIAQQPMDTPASERRDPSYFPPRTPRSRK
jgi:hypothetical protein